MTGKLKIAILAVGMMLATSAFADTYLYTVTFNGIAGFGIGTVQFTTTYLDAPGNNTIINLGSVTTTNVTPGMFLAQLSLDPSVQGAGQLEDISAVWDISGNNSLFINEILYNNAYGPWPLGTQNISGNWGSDFIGNGQGDGNSGTITVQDITTPEPASLALMGSGLIGLAGALRRKILI